MSYNNIIYIFIDIQCDSIKSELITTLPAARMTSDAPVDAALVDELDALRAVYGDDDAFDDDLLVDASRASSTSTLSCARMKDALGRGIVRVVFDATPRASTVLHDDDDDAETYVAVTFIVDVRDDGAYPTEAAPEFRFVDARGFEPDDARALSRDVDASIREHAGEHCLLVMTERVSERVRALNRPRGRCAICFEEFRAAAAAPPTMKLETCWHAFHARCFATWRERRARDFEAIRAEAPNFSEGSEEEKRLREKTTLRCPTCRAPTTEDDARRCERAAARTRRESSTVHEDDDEGDDDDDADGSRPSALDSLDEDARAALESMRASFASAMSAQRRRGGVVDDRRDGGGVVIDETTTFRRADPSTEATRARERAVPPPPTTPTTKKGGKNASWLRRAAARKKSPSVNASSSVPEPKENASSKTERADERARSRVASLER